MFPTQLDKPEGRGTVDASSRAAEAQETIIRKCATLLKMERWRVAGAIALFDDGSTMPFIARYRKESTGGMDETELRALEAALDAAKRLEARRVLRDKKSDEAYQEWVRQLRDRAYVEYRLEER